MILIFHAYIVYIELRNTAMTVSNAKPVRIDRNVALSRTRTLAFKRSVTFTTVVPAWYVRVWAWIVG